MFDVVKRPSLISFTGYHLGLGNRVRAVLGARTLASLEGRAYYYTWPTGSAFGARLDQLWEFKESTLPPVASRLLSLRYPYRDASLGWLDDGARRERVWQIKTGHALTLPTRATSWQEELRALRPTESIASRVVDFFTVHLAAEPYIGVMIRAHSISHSLTLEHSPVEWYNQRMRSIRAELPDVRFFVSCDVPEVQAAVLDEFDGSFALTDKGEYNSLRGLQSSVADLYLLASSGYLLGPHHSSFPELAQYLAGSRLSLETSRSSTSFSTSAFDMRRVVDPTRPAQR